MPKYTLQVVEAKPRANGTILLRLEGHQGHDLFAFVSGTRVHAVKARSGRTGNVRDLCAVYHPHLVAAVEAAVAAYFSQGVAA